QEADCIPDFSCRFSDDCDYIGQTILKPPSATPGRSNLPALRRTYGLTKPDSLSQAPPTRLTTQIATRDTLSSKCFTPKAPMS
ncbi:hypothetical protein GOODEAATRI_033445, partial [Goodea atripinnis]